MGSPLSYCHAGHNNNPKYAIVRKYFHCQLVIYHRPGSTQINKMKLLQQLLKLLDRKSERRGKKVIKKEIKEESHDTWCGSFSTSTPPSFKIYPLNKFETKFNRDLEDDFKIYDEFEPSSNSFLSDVSSCSRSSENDRIYENLVDLVNEESPIFENMVFLSSVQLNRISSDEMYEVMMWNSKNNRCTWRFKPRILSQSQRYQ